jgi:PAS domain S-box-containing protein
LSSATNLHTTKSGLPATPGLQSTAFLLELGAHFALVERASRTGYWREDVDNGLLHWSPGLFRLSGADPRHVTPSHDFLLKYMHPDDAVVAQTAIAEAKASGKPFRYRTRHARTPDDAVRVYETHGDVERDASGRITAVLGVVREVTEEVNRERQLMASEAAYRFMTDEATDIITRHGRDGVPVFVSPALLTVLGYMPGDVLGSTPFIRTHPDDLELVKASIADAKATGNVVTYSYRAKHQQGHWVWLESRVRFVPNPETGEHDSAISVTRDISQRKAVEDELTRARERAEAASHTKSRFLANMSHELRTPLNAIIGFSDVMVREMFGPMANGRYAEYAKLVNESGTLLLDLINDLLDMSKIEAGKFEIHIESFLALDAMDGALQMLRARATDKNIELRSFIEPSDLCVRADRRVFKQVLLNLVSNAIKFTDPGGNISVSAVEASGGVQLTVRDNGIGISPDFLTRIAQPFEQASNDPARTHGGSGLGLALVKSLVALHEGDFAIQSKQGHGTEVTVTLPLDPAAKASSAA